MEKQDEIGGDNAKGPYKKGLPVASVSGTLYPTEGPARIDGLYNKTRAKRLIAQLNAAHAAAIAKAFDQ